MSTLQDIIGWTIHDPVAKDFVLTIDMELSIMERHELERILAEVRRPGLRPDDPVNIESYANCIPAPVTLGQMIHFYERAALLFDKASFLKVKSALLDLVTDSEGLKERATKWAQGMGEADQDFITLSRPITIADSEIGIGKTGGGCRLPMN